MAEEEAIGLLQQLARDFNVRDSRKLFQIARREFPDRRDLTSARAAAALRSDVARQILAPKPRSLGKSAAEGPNDRLQADLVDFSQNTRGRNKYGLVVQDVFTREIATKALFDKRAETVTRAAAEIIPDLVQEERDYVVTTDLGNEFRGLEAALPGGAVHRQKNPTDRNATAVVDRAIQTLKKDLAGKVARDGGGWGDHVDEAAEAYNARPHQAVTVAPEDVETMPAATFRVYQDNARKFKHNDELTRSRQRRLEEAGELRGRSKNGQRSFQPQYGAVRLDDGASHGWLGDSAEACAPGAPRIRGAKGAAHSAAGTAGGAAASRFQSRAHGAAVIRRLCFYARHAGYARYAGGSVELLCPACRICRICRGCRRGSVELLCPALPDMPDMPGMPCAGGYGRTDTPGMPGMPGISGISGISGIFGLDPEERCLASKHPRQTPRHARHIRHTRASASIGPSASIQSITSIGEHPEHRETSAASRASASIQSIGEHPEHREHRGASASIQSLGEHRGASASIQSIAERRRASRASASIESIAEHRRASRASQSEHRRASRASATEHRRASTASHLEHRIQSIKTRFGLGCGKANQKNLDRPYLNRGHPPAGNPTHTHTHTLRMQGTTQGSLIGLGC